MPPRPTVGSSDWEHVHAGNQSQGSHDEQLLDKTEGLTRGRALDLGCGTGANTIELAKRGWSVVGVDLVAEAIEFARSATDSSLDIKYEVGDMTSWISETGFDLVLVSYAIPKVSGGRETAIAHSYDHLKPGGTLIVGDFDAATMSWGKPEDFATVDGMTELLSRFNIVSVESIPTKPHHHGEFTSHSDDTARAVISVARKPE